MLRLCKLETFCGVVANRGLVPSQPKSARQLQASSALFYEVSSTIRRCAFCGMLVAATLSFICSRWNLVAQRLAVSPYFLAGRSEMSYRGPASFGH